MTAPDHEHIRELLVPYSLRMLSDDEARLVREALELSAHLRAELDEIEATSAALVAGSVELERAPAFIKARVLDSIGAADRASAGARKRAERRRPRWSVLVPSALAAGLAGACAVLALVALSFHNDLDDARDDLAATARGSEFTKADMSLRTVSTTGAMETATGQLVRIAEGRYVLLLRNVPDPGAGNSWQVWTADSRGGVTNVGQWVEGSDTQAILVSEDDVREVMVSHEHTEEPVLKPTGGAMATVTV